MADDEERLPGGNVSGPVVRVGDTVRRARRAAAASVEALLVHLERVGFEHSPRFLGVDDQGRQVLRYAPGTASPDPDDLSTSEVREVGRILAELHGAMGSLPDALARDWAVSVPTGRRDQVVHHDPAPWNLVRGAGAMTWIDFDAAGPGSRLEDLAYAAHGFVPIRRDAERELADRMARLSALVDGYGLDHEGRRELVDTVSRRIDAMYQVLRDGHLAGTQPWSDLWRAGHGDVWSSDASAARELGPPMRRALGVD